MELQKMVRDKECGTHIWEVSFQFIIARSLNVREYDDIENKISRLLSEIID